MSWNKYPDKKPQLGQEVLVFCQGYDIKGKSYWSHFSLCIFDRQANDRRTYAFYSALEYRVEKWQGRSLRNCWGERSVTHWMPLPEYPEKISKEKYAELAGYKYEEEKQ